MGIPVKLGQGVVFRPGTAFDERWAPNQFLSGFVTSISGDDASIVLFPDAYAPFYEMRVRRDDSLSQDRTWTPSVGEDQTMPEAPSDGVIYGRRNQAWTPVSGTGQGNIAAIFISDTQPDKPILGMAWFDTTINNFYIFEQNRWIEPGHLNPTEELSIIITDPVITGNVAIDSILTCSTGDWSSSPISFAYQWLRDGTPIPGGTTNQHIIVIADTGTDLVCVVTATNKIGASQPAYSNTVSVGPPELLAAPVLFGKRMVGETISCSTGSWSNAPIIGYAYQWKLDTTPIAGATASQYTILAGDVGKKLICAVTASNLFGPSVPANSNEMSINPPVNTSPPVILGFPFFDEVLACVPGTWENEPTGVTFQWKRSGTDIAGATAPSYTITAADFGSSITCVETATNYIGSTSLATAALPIRTPATLADLGPSAGVNLLNGNLTAQHANPAIVPSYAQANAYKNKNKWYFEVTIGSLAGASAGIGILPQTTTATDMLNNLACIKVLVNGQIYVGGLIPTSPLPMAAGDNIGFAIDLNANKLWLRRNGGFWNGDPNYSPDGFGALIFDNQPWKETVMTPAVCFGGAGQAAGHYVTFNFGRTTFVHPLPAGYYRGWTVEDI